MGWNAKFRLILRPERIDEFWTERRNEHAGGRFSDASGEVPRQIRERLISVNCPKQHRRVLVYYRWRLDQARQVNQVAPGTIFAGWGKFFGRARKLSSGRDDPMTREERAKRLKRRESARVKR
jgi:hypothetical protein